MTPRRRLPRERTSLSARFLSPRRAAADPARPDRLLDVRELSAETRWARALPVIPRPLGIAPVQQVRHDEPQRNPPGTPGARVTDVATECCVGATGVGEGAVEQRQIGEAVAEPSLEAWRSASREVSDGSSLPFLHDAPPTMVRSTRVVRISRGVSRTDPSSKTTRTANVPASSVPFVASATRHRPATSVEVERVGESDLLFRDHQLLVPHSVYSRVTAA